MRIGIFVLLGAFALLLVLFLLTDPATFRGRYMVHTEVADAGGLRQGDPVRMRGVRIGRVHQFDLTEEGVEITLEIEGRWQLPADSHTRLTSGDLLGGRTVEVVPGSAAEIVESGGRLPGATMTSIFDITDEMGTEALAVMERVRDLLSEPTVDGIQGTVTELQDLAGTLAEVARGQRAELERLTQSLNRSAQGIEAASEGGPDLARAIARADSAIVELRGTGDVLQRTAYSLDEVLGRVDRGEGTLGRLSADDALYRSLNEAAENINQAAANIALLAEDVRENPGRYFRFRLF